MHEIPAPPFPRSGRHRGRAAVQGHMRAPADALRTGRPSSRESRRTRVRLRGQPSRRSRTQIRREPNRGRGGARSRIRSRSAD